LQPIQTTRAPQFPPAVCIILCMCGVSTTTFLSSVRAKEGGSVELGCSLPPDTKENSTPNLFPLVEWVRQDYDVPILINLRLYLRVHPNYKGRVSLTQNASLLVERLTQEDEGWFKCNIFGMDRNTDDFHNTTWTWLSITAPPVFINPPPTFVEVLLGDSLTLSCGAHGNPRPTVVWHKDNSPIQKHEKIKLLSGTLSLASVTRNTSGVYICHVSNSVGNLTHSLQLQSLLVLRIGHSKLLKLSLKCTCFNLIKFEHFVFSRSLKSRVKILVDGTLFIPNLIPEDAGYYTCIPTNGILTPPSASAHLSVKYPARVRNMPREMYLPAGLEGAIVCPFQADPPVLYVNWTKDGHSLDLDQFPGWMVNSEGSIFITTVNDNAVGVYTCTAFNSYGTMGQSEPTQVLLQDPPLFTVTPEPEYFKEVGRALTIPCEASGDPTPNITWSKIGPVPQPPYTVLADHSLLLQPLNKDHHGGWECLASNRVATVSAGTLVKVLGTSPHTVSSVYVATDINQANVSWISGFDGGFTQKFTVWFKQESRREHEWVSLPVPTSKNNLLVTGLLGGTSYQFCILPQNKLGSGPFSEILTVRTKVLAPPTLLAVNWIEKGLLLLWSPPEDPSTTLTDYVLEARSDQGQWKVLSSNIRINQSELLIQGLLRDSSYEFRLMSRSNKILSDPSNILSVSTNGEFICINPTWPGFLGVIPRPLLAGVLGGLCFLFFTIILSLVTACYMAQRRRLRRKRRQDFMPCVCSFLSTRPPRSPNSILNLKLCPTFSFSPISSASQSDSSSFETDSRGEYHDQKRKQLLSSSPPLHYTLFESHLGSQDTSPSMRDSISRGPDGRFTVQPQPEPSSPSNDKNLTQSKGVTKGSGSIQTSLQDSPKSSLLSSEKDERKDSSLIVNSPVLSRPSCSPGRIQAMARNFSRHGCFYSDEEQNRYHVGLIDNSTLVTQVDCEPERDGFNTSVKLSKERETPDKSYSADQQKYRSEKDEDTSSTTENLQMDVPETKEEPMWRPQDVTIRQKHRASGQASRLSDYRRGCYFWNTSSPMDRTSSSHINWDISPVTSVKKIIPVQSLREITSPNSTDSLVANSSRSPPTSNTVLSADISSKSAPNPDRARSLSPQSDANRSSATEQATGIFPRSRHSYAYGGLQDWKETFKGLADIGEKTDNSVSAHQIFPERLEVHTATKDSSPSSSSTLPYEHHDIGAKPKHRDVQGKSDFRTSGVYTELERENVRKQSRKSNKFIFSDSPSPVSSLTLVEEVESPQSNLSVTPMSESSKVKAAAPPAKMSPLQTSTIVEYMSIPSFNEMSVEKPVEKAEIPDTAGQKSATKPGKPLSKPDVVPRNWEVRAEEDQETVSVNKEICLEENYARSKKGYKYPLHVEHRDSAHRVRFPDERRSSSPSPEKASKQLYDEKRQIRGWSKDSDRPGSRLGCALPCNLLNAVRGVADIASKQSLGFVDRDESSSKQPQRRTSQSSRTNNVASRINQVPVPILKKSMSFGPCRPVSGMSQPLPFLKKSISLGAQRCQPFEIPRTYVSEKCYRDEFPYPDIRMKSSSRTPSPVPRPGHSWRDYVPFRQPSIDGLERPSHTYRPLLSPSYHSPVMYPPRPFSVSPTLEPVDPHRQATIFLDSSRCSPPYEETLRSAQYKYLHLPSHIPVQLHQQSSGYRGENTRPMEPRRGPPRSYLPRGISCPSSHYSSPYLSREGDGYRHTERISCRGGETEIRSGGRTSFASQSSGRGSAGLYQRSLSITPTLLSSPETTDESKRHQVELELLEIRGKR
uniref:Protein turtle homolog A-like n=1 Tax=Cynoglossus semilaevis TaxID=244447 RepID=A0A3P8WJ90_CYNSE